MPRMGTDSREAFRTYHDVFDRFTESTILKFMGQGIINGLIGPLSIGKEANVFLAEAKNGKTVIVKIYRLSTCDFNRMFSFIRTDPRFPKMNRQRRKVVFAWAQREYRNLFKSRQAGVRVPTPIAYKNNVLIMDLVGKTEAAPKAKDIMPKDSEKFIAEIINQMKKMHKAGMVHGDLSPFNILNDKDKPVFIDMSQTTVYEDPNAQEYLTRDLKNIAAYARRLGVEITAKELRAQVTE
jgi:RIO kinase 1